MSIPIGANVGELAVSVPSIRVKSGWSATVEMRVKSIAGPQTTAKLTPSTSLPTEVPNCNCYAALFFLSIEAKASLSPLSLQSPQTRRPGSHDWLDGVGL